MKNRRIVMKMNGRKFDDLDVSFYAEVTRRLAYSELGVVACRPITNNVLFSVAKSHYHASTPLPPDRCGPPHAAAHKDVWFVHYNINLSILNCTHVAFENDVKPADDDIRVVREHDGESTEVVCDGLSTYENDVPKKLPKIFRRFWKGAKKLFGRLDGGSIPYSRMNY